MKKKLDDFTKMKLIYSGELLAFAVLFAVLGPLFLFEVITVADWKRWAFSIVTLLGGLWLIADFVWCLISEKRRKKNSMLDKTLVLPMALPVVVFDILAFVKGWVWLEEGIVYFRYALGIALSYYAIVYLFEAIYHFKHPVPMLLEEIEKAEAESAAEKPLETTVQEENGAGVQETSEDER